MTELLFILLLLLFNSVFAMAEIVIVSAKKARMMERTENPERFLSTVQNGIKLAGVLAGAFGGASLAGYVTPWLKEAPWHAEELLREELRLRWAQ